MSARAQLSETAARAVDAQVRYTVVPNLTYLVANNYEAKEAQEIFDQTYIVDQKNDDPEQFRAIGWCLGRLCSVIFEIRHDSRGEYYHLVTAWKATREEEENV